MSPDQSIRDPKPAVERIEVLASRILDGDILLPKFQRDFVWERPQILDLLDSISNNYPIGSVLLWLSRQKLHSEKSIGGLRVKERHPEYPVNYLLDGQQRLSSICGALFWDGSDKDSMWNIVYDLRKLEFAHLNTLDDPPLHQIRMNKLPDAAAFFRHVASLDSLDAQDKDVLKFNAEALFKRFKDYTIATVTLSDMPIESVAPIFERINSTGTRLTIVDLMRAATWSEEFDLIDTIDGEVLEAISEKGFGGVDRKAVLRNLSASAGGGFSVDSIDHLRERSPDELRTAAEATVEAYKRAVDFLTNEIGAPSDSIIPYINQVVVLAELFRLVPTPSARQYASLKRWFWRTTLSGYFGGWNTGQMSGDLAALRKFASGESNDIELDVMKPTREIWRTRQFRANNAHAKMLGLMLSQHGPRDLVTGQRISLERALSWSNSREYHHFFPQAFLKTQGASPNKINSVANFVLITSASNKRILHKSPSVYIPELRNQLRHDFEQVMKSNMISNTALEAALDESFEDFLNERSETLHQYALQLCEWY